MLWRKNLLKQMMNVLDQNLQSGEYYCPANGTTAAVATIVITTARILQNIPRK